MKVSQTNKYDKVMYFPKIMSLLGSYVSIVDAFCDHQHSSSS
jgi:hypothetical protein